MTKTDSRGYRWTKWRWGEDNAKVAGEKRKGLSQKQALSYARDATAVQSRTIILIGPNGSNREL